MNRKISILGFLFTCLIVLSFGAFGATVNIVVNGYEGKYRINSTQLTGDVSIELEAQNKHVFYIGSKPSHGDYFYFDTDELGNVSNITKPLAATSNSNTITLNTTPVTINPGEYAGIWYVLGFSSPEKETAISYQLPVGIDQRINFDGSFAGYCGERIDNYSFITDYRNCFIQFSVNEDGTVYTDQSDSVTLNSNEITLNTTAITIDPSNISGWYNLRGAPSIFAYSNEIQTVNYVKGIRFPILVGQNWLSIDIQGDGTVSTMFNESIDASAQSVVFKGVPINFNPGQFLGGWVIPYGTSRYFGRYYGAENVSLIPGVSYLLYAGYVTNPSNRESITIGVDGSVSGSNTEAFNFSGNSVTFNNTVITVDPGNYEDGWRLQDSHPNNSTNNYTGINDIILVPGLTYFASLNSWRSGFEFTIDSSDNVGLLNDSNAATTDNNVITFNTANVSIVPSDLSKTWMLLAYAKTRTEQIKPTGVFDTVLVNDVNYSILVDGEHKPFIVVSECTPTPDVLEIGQVSFDLSATCIVPDPDSDYDGIPDSADNCPLDINEDQMDIDIDGLGDVCDTDRDGDTIPDAIDNCPAYANFDQSDTNNNGIGDACDADIDGDSVPNASDNCIYTPNTDQADNDLDLFGDMCDSDDDNDNVNDSIDNCPLSANEDQNDSDADGAGDICDGDIDNDGVSNENDYCPLTSSDNNVNEFGCSGPQFIEISCLREDYAIHGHYVSCVTKAVKEAVEQGLIDKKDKGRYIKEAAKNK